LKKFAVRFVIWLIEIKVKEYRYYYLFNFLSICIKVSNTTAIIDDQRLELTIMSEMVSLSESSMGMGYCQVFLV